MSRNLAQLAVAASDLKASARFYTEILELTETFRAPNVVGYAVGEARLLLTQRSSLVATASDPVIPYFSVEGIQRVHEQLRSVGAPNGGDPHVVARHQGKEVWVAFVRDPAGNLVGLIEER